jgi:hypothetical protein
MWVWFQLNYSKQPINVYVIFIFKQIVQQTNKHIR